MKIVFFGSTDFSKPILEKIHGECEVSGVVISRPKPKGRGLRKSLPEIAEWAKGKRLKVYMPDEPNTDEFVRIIEELTPDVYVLSAYGHILSKRLLDIPKAGGINIHPSLLPRYRGAAPIQRAIMAGEDETGVTLFFMDEKIDHGEMIAQQCIPIEKDDTFGSLSEKLAKLGAEMIVDVLDAAGEGTLHATAQKGKASYAPKLKKEELWIDWNENAMKLYNQIRALSPRPGAKTGFRKKELIITLAQLGVMHLNPGVLHVENRKLYVGTGDGALILLEVKPGGRKLMSALDFINGYRIKEGEVLE